jgi:PAS domain S-box-containing protein
MTVLYVEDENDILESISEVLEDLFNEVITATNGGDALALFNYHKNIDMIITDINMPQMDGLELIEHIRKIDKNIPILITSAHSDHDFLIKSIELKVDGYILKPVDVYQLISEIEKIKENIVAKKELKKNLKLLDEYKSAIDESALVSKTDKRGVITYVNDSFCKISGYTKDELIGKNHNIVRDSDTPSSVFKILWKTIKSKKSWKGIIKNRKKDGGIYYVDSHVIPILNVNNEIEEFIAIRNDITQLELYKQDIENELEKATKEIIDTQKEVVFTMGAIGETRSKETGLHVKRVAEYSYLLATLYGLSQDEASLLRQASPMHDIGKVGIPDSVLNKPGRFNDDEREIMNTHAQLGYDMLKHSNRDILKAAATVAYEHHEKWDGSGYPRGLKGEEIHIFGRITAIADVFDALGHDRVYKKAWELEKILELFKENRGTHFDPQLIDIFLTNLDKVLEIKDKLGDD